MATLNSISKSLIGLSIGVVSTACSASGYEQCEKDWLNKSDQQFAADCAAMAFDDDLKAREQFAWMAFTRINQLIKDSHGLSKSDKVPQWMAWATDDDTFKTFPTFKFTETNRADITEVTSKKVLAGEVSMTDPDSANEEVTRNAVSYNYLTETAKLNTKVGVLTYLKAGNQVDMPVGTIELKASWLKVPPGGAPEGALTFGFESGEYWWRGVHIMVKMRSLKNNDDLFYSEEPSWFWTTFEFNGNPGLEHVRDQFVTQRAPLSDKERDTILKQGGISGFGFEHYSPNGTQIRYTENAESKVPVILGHTDMEDFAGAPNTAQPSYWTSFNSSCHTCHATAAINPETETYFPFSVPVGKLSPQYYGQPSADKPNLYLGDGFVPLDFMWPIAFHAK
jgi:hypothetical protein